MKRVLAIAAALLLLACTASGPQKALNDLAEAMEKNNSQAFLAGIDMNDYAANYIRSMTDGSEAVNTLNTLGKMFGLGNLNELIGNFDELFGNIVDMRKRISGQFNRGVASGELMAQCRQADTPDCPWVPQSLRNARIVEIGQNAAIAQVTTPARLTSWLALRNIDGKWLVVGQAVMEATAREFATGANKTRQGGQTGAPATGKAL